MQQEIEIKILDVDPDVIRSRLTQLGAVCNQPMRLMRRVLFDHPDRRFHKAHHAQRLRVRDEGGQVAINYKAKNDTPYVDEIEVVVDSFDNMVKLLEEVGLDTFTFQESKREAWHYKDCEVVIDIWPWLNPYIEIEGPDEATIRAVATDLGYGWQDACFGSVDTAYRHQYPGLTKAESIGDIEQVRFDAPLPEILETKAT